MKADARFFAAGRCDALTMLAEGEKIGAMDAAVFCRLISGAVGIAYDKRHYTGLLRA